jgi:Zn-dependent peptidase ImmA (M78 family)
VLGIRTVQGILFAPSPGGRHLVIDEVTDRKSHAAEQRARAFAAELLLPQEGLKRMGGASQMLLNPGAALELVAQARRRFGTPHDIAANHLCNLRLVDLSLRKWLEEETTNFARTPPTTTLPEGDAPSLFVAEHVERAHREGLLTDGEARAILGIDVLAPLPWDEVEL